MTPKLATRQCRECRTSFTPHRYDKEYCSLMCGKRARTRALARGAAIYQALYWWRLDRKNCRLDLLFIAREIKSWIDEDRAHQRLPPPRHRHDADRGYQRRRGSGAVVYTRVPAQAASDH